MTIESPKYIEQLMNARGNSQRGCRQRDRPQGEPRQTLEVDFVANKGGQRYYVQSAYQLLSDEKMIQEKRSLLHINDSFKKILLTMDHQNVRHDENGIVTMGLMHFLSDKNSLEA